MSSPISAMMTSAVRGPTPGIEHNSGTAAAKGAIAASIRCDNAAMSSSTSAMWASMRSSRNA